MDDFRKLTDEAILNIKAAQLADENGVLADAVKYARDAQAFLNVAILKVVRETRKNG